MSLSEKERIVALETSLTYIKEKLDSIESKMDSFTSFKFQVIGASGIVALIISAVANMINLN